MNKHRTLYHKGVGEPSSKYGYHNQHLLDKDVAEKINKFDQIKINTKAYIKTQVIESKLLPDTVWSAVIEALTEIKDEYA